MAGVRKATDHRANRLLAALDPDDFARIESSLQMVDLPAGKILYEVGDTILDAYFPHRCVVSLVAVLSDGGTAEVAMFGCEGVVGVISAMVSRETFGRYVVQVAGTASRLPLTKAQEMFGQSPSGSLLLRRYTGALLMQTFQTVACNALHGVEARCCRWILATQDRMDQDTLPLTHEFLSEMLGVQRPTVSLVTRRLQAAGLIRQGRGVVTILDRDGLEQVSCECYRTIRRNFERLLPRTYADTGSRFRASSAS
jgi:CRP-like cAMP-binding protein